MTVTDEKKDPLQPPENWSAPADLAEKQMRPDMDGKEAVAFAAASEKHASSLKPQEQQSALDWFLSDEPDTAEGAVKTLKLNFGTDDTPRYIEWQVQPVTFDKMREIRQRARNTPLARRTGELDEYYVQLNLIVEGTVDPDLRFASKQKGMADPAEALRMRFGKKPGYIAQIAAEIMSMSGFNDGDVQIADAAGN